MSQICSEILNYNEECPPVSNLRPGMISSNSITITWDPTNAEHYIVKISEDFDTWSEVVVTELTMYTFINLNPDQTYYFQVTTYCDEEIISDSIIISIITLP